jgi:hypothetical protein
MLFFLAALELHNSGLRATEDPANDHRRYKSRETIRIPEVSAKS